MTTPVPRQLTLPLDGADDVLARFERRLRGEVALIGLTLWTGALRRWHALIRERERQAAEQILLAEYQIEREAPAGQVLATLARAKGLLVAAMLALALWQVVAGDDPVVRPARRGRRRDEIELVAEA